MWSQLAALLQVLNEQQDTVLSDISRKALKACVRTGTCNNVCLCNVCGSLRCSFCRKVINGRAFSISLAISRYPYIKCEDCWDRDIKLDQQAYDALAEEDKEFLRYFDAKPADKYDREEGNRAEAIYWAFHRIDLPENIDEEIAEIDKEREEDEKIVYPFGRNNKAYWERLLEVRGVPLVPPQLTRGEVIKP